MLMIGTCLIDRVLVGDSETMIYWGRIGYDFARHASRALLVYQRFQDVYKYRHSLQSLVQTLQETPWWQHVLIGKMQSDVSLDYIGSSAQAGNTFAWLMETAVTSDLHRFSDSLTCPMDYNSTATEDESKVQGRCEGLHRNTGAMCKGS